MTKGTLIPELDVLRKRTSRRVRATAWARAGAATLSVLFGSCLASESFVTRPIYSEPATGLQLPPGCEVDPSWRSTVANSDLEIWIAKCSGEARAWLVKRAVVEVLNSRQSRLRFEVMDERVLADETPGESLSVQCTGPRDETGYVVRGAHWRTEGKELRLKSAKAVMKADARTQTLVESEIGDVDCSRFPEREAMMKRLQQGHD
jgi:hypothetical protein